MFYKQFWHTITIFKLISMHNANFEYFNSKLKKIPNDESRKNLQEESNKTKLRVLAVAIVKL